MALGLPDNFGRAGLLGGSGEPFCGLLGPGVVLSGSCSVASRNQLARYLLHHPGLAVEPQALLTGALTVETACRFACEHGEASPAVHSSADPATVATAQQLFGRKRVAEAVESFFGSLAMDLMAGGFARSGGGGGETAGAVVTALGLRDLVVGPEIHAGVPALASRGHDGRPIRLALKSGNFGSPDFYAKALEMLEVV